LRRFCHASARRIRYFLRRSTAAFAILFENSPASRGFPRRSANTIEAYALRASAYELVVSACAAELVASSTLPDLSFDTRRVFAA
jgi:hypothetical protein